MKKTIIALFALLISNVALADPTVFGLTISKTKVEELKNKYSVTYTGQNKYSGGDMYEIATGQIGFDGLNSLTAIFSKEGVLIAVLTGFPKSKFDYLKSSLSNKYQLVSQKIPFVGNKSAKYKDGNTEIELNAPHMSFEMTMNYIHTDLLRAFNNQSASEERAKKKKESSML
tara:strand:- start:12480 stop:12995 length:516 start_codon:yes stop_codon:yes gene_type:complete